MRHEVSVVVVNDLEHPKLFKPFSWFTIDKGEFVQTYSNFLHTFISCCILISVLFYNSEGLDTASSLGLVRSVARSRIGRAKSHFHSYFSVFINLKFYPQTTLNLLCFKMNLSHRHYFCLTREKNSEWNWNTTNGFRVFRFVKLRNILQSFPIVDYFFILYLYSREGSCYTLNFGPHFASISIAPFPFEKNKKTFCRVFTHT